MKLSTPSKKEIKAIKTTAENTFKKDKRIAIRLYEHDFTGIQKKAMEMGISYQTLISGIIHRYIEGELISKTGYYLDFAREVVKKSENTWVTPI